MTTHLASARAPGQATGSTSRRGGDRVIAESKENADRLVAPRFIWFQLAKAARHRGLVASAELDGLHVSAWDVESGQITPLDITTDGFFDSVWVSAMGEGVYRLRDDGGNEMGHLTYTSIVGGREIDLTPNAPNYTLRGSDVSLDGSLVAVTQVSETGFGGRSFCGRCRIADRRALPLTS